MKITKDIWEKHNSEYIKFDRIPKERRLSNRPDLHAFILLDQLCGGTLDMVAGAGHDEIYLEVSPDALDLREDQIIDLIRCGVRYDGSTKSFAMFV